MTLEQYKKLKVEVVRKYKRAIFMATKERNLTLAAIELLQKVSRGNV